MMKQAEKSQHKRQMLPGLTNTAFGFFIAGAGQLVGTFDPLLVRLSAAPPGSLDGWQIIFWRFLSLAILLSVPLVFAYKDDHKVLFTRCFDKFGLACAVSLSLCQLAYTWALHLMPAADTIVIFACCPVLTAVLSRLFLNESVSSSMVLITMLASISVFMVFYGELGSANTIGLILAALSALSMAAYSTGCYAASRKEPSRDMLPSLALAGYLTALIAFVGAKGAVAANDAHAYAIVLAQGLVLSLWISALTIAARFITPVSVNMVLLIDPLLAPLWVWLAGFESPPKHATAGGIGLACCLLLLGWVKDCSCATRKSSRANSTSECYGSVAA